MLTAASIISYGGGSVIDTGKAVAALLTNPGDPINYLEVIGKGLPIRNQPAFYLAIPTTSGTGAEVTPNAVLSSTRHMVKVSMRHQKMLPDIALVDPELTLSMPPSLTASTGLDALTQLIEAYISPFSNPLVDGICEQGIKHACRSLKKAWERGDDLKAREDMSIASLFSGFALANAKLGAVHGIAGPLGAMIKAPHGLICGKLLPFVMETNIRALDHDHPCLDRFQKIAAILTNNPRAIIKDGIDWINQICDTFKLAPLRKFGLTAEMIPTILTKSLNSSSMKGNPVELTKTQIQSILKQII
ncbi:MAG: iron-containing alcohol dehydrogenase [Desulfobacteraceae bacterium]|nr:iron-containing alcohol dehydrogenase [Desulfobacteraceae bacterium]